MVDETFDRTYREGRAELNVGLNRGFVGLAKRVSESLAALHRLQWNAPWAAADRAKCN